jgi:hypothetical protein
MGSRPSSALALGEMTWDELAPVVADRLATGADNDKQESKAAQEAKEGQDKANRT